MPERHRGLITFLVGLTLAKLLLGAVLGWSVSVNEIHAQAEGFLAGLDVLDPKNTGNNPSFFLIGNYLVASGSLLLADALHLPFGMVIKWPAILSDLGIAILLLGFAEGGRRAALVYLLSPVTVVLSTYHGQLHTVALFATLLAVRLVEKRRTIWAGLALAIATSLRQHFAVLAVTMARTPRGVRWTFALSFVLSLGLLNAPLLLTAVSPGNVLLPAINYGAWGYGMLLLQTPRLLTLWSIPHPTAFFALLNGFLEEHANTVAVAWPVAFALISWLRPTRNVWGAAFVFVTGVYVFTPAISVQWLVWALPFLALLWPRAGVAYSLLAGSFILGSYWQWSLNAEYGVSSLTRNLGLLSLSDLAGVVAVGALGLGTWAFCVWLFIRLLSGRGDSPDAVGE